MAELLHATPGTPGSEDQIALRAGVRLGARLARVPREDPGHEDRFRVRAQASYLITGGLGALGLRTARWLVEERGARTVVLTSRRPPGPDAEAALAALRARGADVRAMQADITDPADVERLFDAIARTLPPLRGVIHCAGTLDDGVLDHMTWAQLTRVTRPKIRGGWLLHEHTRHLSLDFFVLYSSVLGLLGSAGQANYTAANAFLDGLSAHRRALGLPALSIGWGPWADAGLATRAGERGRAIWKRRGTAYLDHDRAMAALAAVTARDLDQTAVTITDWRVYGQQLFQRPPFLARLVPASTRPSARTDAVRARLAEAPASEHRAILLALLRTTVQEVLGLEAHELDGDQPLDALGLDSLLAVELVNRLQHALQIRVPTGALLQGTSLAAMVDALLPHLPAPEPGAGAAERGAPAAPGAPATNAPGVPIAPAHGAWITLPERRPDATTRLFCFPFAGGGPGIYRAWPAGLPADIEVYTVVLPGQGPRRSERPLTRIDRIVDGLMPALLPLLDRPFALFGHCMGAIVAYEVARRLLRDHGHRPARLFASGAPAPHLYTLPSYYEQPDDKLLDVLQSIGFSATRALVEDEDMRRLAFPSVRADLEAAARYAGERAAGPPLDIPITAFGGWEDLYAAPRAVAAWAAHTSSGYARVMRPGNHYFLEAERAPILERVARDLLPETHGGPSNHLKTCCACRCLRWGTSKYQEYSSAPRLGLDPLTTVLRWLPSGDTPPPGDASRAGRARPGEERPLASAQLERHRAAPGPTTSRLICFPSVWGAEPGFARWPEGLPPGVEVVSIRLPAISSGPEPRPGEPPGAGVSLAVEDLVEDLAAALAPELDRPFRFFGHGFGAILAFEVARILRRARGAQPAHLFVAAAPAPDLFVMPLVQRQPDGNLLQYLRTIDHPAGHRRAGASMDAEHLARLRAGFALMASYEHHAEPPLDAGITAFGAWSDMWTAPLALRSWKHHTARSFHLFMRNGDHFFADQERFFLLQMITDQIVLARAGSLAGASGRA